MGAKTRITSTKREMIIPMLNAYCAGRGEWVIIEGEMIWCLSKYQIIDGAIVMFVFHNDGWIKHRKCTRAEIVDRLMAQRGIHHERSEMINGMILHLTEGQKLPGREVGLLAVISDEEVTDANPR